MAGSLNCDALATGFGLLIISGSLLLPALGILYGTPVAPFEFPEIARIYLRGRVHCTASILNWQWIITSPYCFTIGFTYIVRNYSDFIVNVGDHDANVREPSEQNLTIVDVIFQDKFK